MEVWILTEERNEYNQYGEYFIAAFKHKPSLAQLAKYVNRYYNVEHVWNGGGRTDQMEDKWWNLRKEVCE